MPTTLIIVAAVAILIILLATASYKVCPADRVMVITGPGGRRFVSGGSAFIIPFIMRVDWLSLGAVQSLLRTDTPPFRFFITVWEGFWENIRRNRKAWEIEP